MQFSWRRQRSIARGTPLRRRAPRSIEFCEARFALSAAGLVVTELMYHPPAPSAAETAAGFTESDFDFIELQNVGASAIDLAGVRFSQGIEFTFGGGSLAPGEYVVVVADAAAFAMRYGAGINVAGAFSGSLANGGEQLVIADATGAVVLSFTYDDAWQPDTDGNGRTLVIVDPFGTPMQWNDAASWTASTSTYGSPGRSEEPSDSTPPTAPGDLSATIVASTVQLTWGAASDPETGISAYRVFRDGRFIGSTTATTFADAAPANATYEYSVVAVNGALIPSGASNQATITLPYVGETPAFAPAQDFGGVALPGRETSGIAASQRNPGVFWVHNDGEQNRFYAINSQGQVLGTMTLSGVTGLDIEDIAVGPGPAAGESYVYLGDIGDNNADRPSVAVIRIREPVVGAAVGGQSQTIAGSEIDVIHFIYPTGPVDAEALMIDPLSGDLYVLSKEVPTSRLFWAAAGSLVGGAVVPLAHVGNVAFGRPSAAAISPLGNEILVRDEDGARLFVRAAGQSVAAALAGTPLVVPVVGTPTEPNGEGITFDAAGNHYYTIGEGRDPPLYYFHRTSRSPGQSTPILEGDLNGDARVGLADLAILQRHFGALSGAPASQGDLDGNGTVDRADAARLAHRFGATSASQAPAASAKAAAAIAGISPVGSSPSAAAAITARADRASRLQARRATRAAGHTGAVDSAILAIDTASLRTGANRRVGRTK